MNRLILVACALAGCLDTVTTSETDQDLNGDTWTTADDNPYTAGTGATANGIAISPTSHKILVAGARGEVNGTTTWIVRGTPDGVTWGLNSAFKYVATGSSVAYNVTVDSLGFFYVVGTARDADNRYHWVVRKSLDDGQTWQTAYDQAGFGATDIPSGMSVDAAGNVFVTGSTSSGGTGIVIRGLKHGTSWGIVFTHAGTGTDNSFYGTCTAPFGSKTATYAVGWESAAGMDTYATFYYSLDQGTTWASTTEVGDDTYTHAYGCAPAGAYTDIAAGTWRTSPTIQSNWLAMIWDFSTLTELEAYPLASNGATTQNAAIATVHVAAPAARSYFAGQLLGSNGGLQWETLYHADNGGGAFPSSDLYTYPGSSFEAKPLNAAYDATRGLYVVGYAYDKANRQHGIVRHRQ